VTNPSEFKLDAGRWQMVPVQPTLQMCEAMGLKWESPWDGGFPKLWVAALAASPSPPSEPDGDDLGAHLSQLAEAFGHKPTIVLSRHTFARIRAALATRPAAPDGEVSEAMVEAGLAAARDASDARLPRYKVVRAIIEAARIAPVALSSEERIALEYAEQRWSGSTKSADHEMATILCALVRRLTTNEPKGNDR
jgi:hypothetical protein